MKDRDVQYWEDLARREPYFPVLGTDGRTATEGGSQPSAAFFATGEADVSALLVALNSLLGREIPLGSVLDFGCGAGRLTLPLARRAGKVVACDVAPTILSHARENARRGGLSGIEFVQGCTKLTGSSFDFICSLCVFEHVPASDGYALIRRLARLLAPAGIAAIQLPLGSAGTRGGLPARFQRPAFRSRLRMADVLGRGGDTRANVYSHLRVVQAVASAGARPVARLALGNDVTADTVFVFERP